MKLERLTLHGFKSFADRTELRFHDGITAVVGPNGCGKSNISDAIRWVLGEQRASAIRGSKMEEAIFQGTAERRGLSRAEVSLDFLQRRPPPRRRLRRDRGPTDSLPRGRERVPAQQARLSSQGHPRPAPRYRARRELLHGHRAADGRRDPLGPDRRSAPALRGGRRDRAVQGPSQGRAAPARGRGGRPRPTRGPDRRGRVQGPLPRAPAAARTAVSGAAGPAPRARGDARRGRARDARSRSSKRSLRGSQRSGRTSRPRAPRSAPPRPNSSGAASRPARPHGRAPPPPPASKTSVAGSPNATANSPSPRSAASTPSGA